MAKSTIERLKGREIINGRGLPAVEVEITLSDGTIAHASCPSGTSLSSHEAVEIRDGGDRLAGKGVLRAVSSINETIAPRLRALEVADQRQIDELLLDLDGTPTKERLGGNAITAVSLAVARAAAKNRRIPIFRHLRTREQYRIPILSINLISGSTTAKSKLDFEDYLIVPYKFETVREALVAAVEVFHCLNRRLERKYGLIPQITALAPPLRSSREALDSLMEAISKAGYDGRIGLALDVAADLIYDSASKTYSIEGSSLSTDETIAHYANLAREYPMVFIEDGLHENDMGGFAKLTQEVPGLIVGDDLFSTNSERLQRGVDRRACNAMLFKVNQAGTVTEALDTAALASRHGYSVVASTRSGETEDPIQVHTAIAANAQLMKLGSPVRGEMVAKYNEFLRIEDAGDGDVGFWGRNWKQVIEQ